jgi:glycosyltransferase involved in cell wall biosynthesis
MDRLRVLIVHQNFPGQFRHLAPWLAAQGHQVVCLGDAHNVRIGKDNLPFKLMSYHSKEEVQSRGHHYLRSFESAVRRGQCVVRACIDLRNRGFTPDLVVGHPAWGEMLFLRDVFPQAKILSYFEYFYNSHGGDVGFDAEFPSTLDTELKLRIRNSTQLHALSECSAGVSPTRWQRSTYPAHEQSRIHVIHEGVNSERVKPYPEASFQLRDGRTLTRKEQVVTFVSRNLEPYRGFHVFMRALPELQRRLPHAHFVVVGADGVSYGRAPSAPHHSYREQYLAEVGSHLDTTRVHFTGRLPYDDFLNLMQVSKLHIYLTYPFVLSWSMLEAMACGAPVLGSATAPVCEVIDDGVNGFLFDFFDREQMIEKSVRILSEDTTEICAAARSKIEKEFSTSKNSLPAYGSLLNEIFQE